MELLAGGGLLLVASAAAAELGMLDPAAVSVRSLVGLGYLILFGSLLAFSAYVFLLRASTPEHVATYAYVNPLGAVLLGWLVLGEAVTGTVLIAAVIRSRRDDWRGVLRAERAWRFGIQDLGLTPRPRQGAVNTRDHIALIVSMTRSDSAL